MILSKYEKIKSTPSLPFLLHCEIQIHNQGGKLSGDKPAGSESLDKELPEGMRSPAVRYSR